MSEHLPECPIGDVCAPWNAEHDLHGQWCLRCEADCCCERLRAYGERLTADYITALLEQVNLGAITAGSLAVVTLTMEEVRHG